MATVYLDWTLGDDARTYVQAQSSATPWKTPTKVEASATTGDTIIMASGTYTWATINFSKSFTFQAATVGGVVLDAGGLSIHWYCNASKFLTLTGLTFTNASDASGAGSGIGIIGNSGVITATNCTFYNIFGSGGNPGNSGVLNIYQSITSGVINATSCLFYNIGRSGANSYGVFAGRICTTCTFNITNCTIYSNETTPVTAIVYLAGTASATVNMRNTLCVDAKSASLSAIEGSTTQNSTYSCFYGTTSETGTGNITSDPLFIDAPNGNFNLRPSSPCIDTGTTS